MLRKKRINLSEHESPGVKAYEDINMLCCRTFIEKQLLFEEKTCKDLNDMVAKLEIIENDVKSVNAIREILLDWQDGKLSDRRTLVLILEIIGKPAYHYYQNKK